MADCVAPTYLPASYNGVFFDAVSAGSEHGRRGVTGEFPFGEQTASQDMGIKIRKFSIKGRFQGPDCIAQTGALIAAVETVGPGTLVHPTRGVLQVSCASLKIADDIVSGQGETNFDMDFFDAGTLNVGLVGLPIITQILPIIQAVQDSFLSNYTIDVVPFFQKNAVQDTSVSALTTLSKTLSDSIPDTGNQINVWQAVHQTQAAASNSSTWISAKTMISSVQSAFNYIDVYGANAQTKYDANKTLANKFSKTATVSGVAGDCQEALISSLRIMAAAYMVRVATQTVSVTLEDALDKLDEITTIILEEKQNAINTNNDDLYIALSNFEAIAFRALTNYAYNLPAIIIYDFSGGVPSLVAAHEIYGDISQSVALEGRNKNNWAFALGPKIYAAVLNR